MSKGAFRNFKFKNMSFKNKVVMAPESSNSADSDGMANEFHFNHYASKALNSVGTVVVEATATTENGRKSQRDLGIWSDKHIKGLKKISNTIKEKESVAGIQLYHNYVNDDISEKEISGLVKSFKKAAKRAIKSGFDFVEINADAITQFLSKDLNKRSDDYGGSFENRSRLLREIVKEVRTILPKDKVMAIRIPAYLYQFEDEKEELSHLISILRIQGVDLINLSTDGDKHLIKCDNKVEISSMPLICGGLINLACNNDDIIDSKLGLAFLGKAILRDSYFIINEVKTFASSKVYKTI